MKNLYRTEYNREWKKIKKDLEDGYTQDFEEQEINTFNAYPPTDHAKTLVPTQPGRNQLHISVKTEKRFLIQEIILTTI